jgi:hydroxymethylpyrimidine/phosphomethylpyrimidine kinase
LFEEEGGSVSQLEASRDRVQATATALTIGGSDPSGGAGLQADLKTFQQLGVYGMSVVTLLTVQNTQGVQRVELMSTDIVREQWDFVTSDIVPSAIKVGALGSAEMVRLVADCLAKVAVPIVVDPVIVSKHGHSLAKPDVVSAYRSHLLPLATIVTPNRFEAEQITELPLKSEKAPLHAMDRFHELGIGRVLIKGGSQAGSQVHWLSDGNQILELRSPSLPSRQLHGTGCILSAALTASLAISPKCDDWSKLVSLAIARTLDAIDFPSQLGHGVHPADVRGMASKKPWDISCRLIDQRP